MLDNTMQSEDAIKQVQAALNIINTVRLENPCYEGQIMKEAFEWYNNWGIIDKLYVPDAMLISRIEDYQRYLEGKNDEDPGKLMEEIAFLAFRCIKGDNDIKSYTSYSQQHDLVVSGSSQEWVFINDFLHLNKAGRTIVVEAKNQKDPVSDAQFSRLCYVVRSKFKDTCYLGVFFSRTRATGFDDKASVRVLRDARATQVIFHAETGKYIVVLEHNDLLELMNRGSLLKLLEEKIRDAEAAAGILRPDMDIDEYNEVSLPSHLRKYL